MHYRSNIDDDVPSYHHLSLRRHRCYFRPVPRPRPKATHSSRAMRSYSVPNEIMLPKSHGTTDMPVQENLRFGASTREERSCTSYVRFYIMRHRIDQCSRVSRTLADGICCHNRMFAGNGRILRYEHVLRGGRATISCIGPAASR